MNSFRTTRFCSLADLAHANADRGEAKRALMWNAVTIASSLSLVLAGCAGASDLSNARPASVSTRSTTEHSQQLSSSALLNQYKYQEATSSADRTIFRNEVIAERGTRLRSGIRGFRSQGLGGGRRRLNSCGLDRSGPYRRRKPRQRRNNPGAFSCRRGSYWRRDVPAKELPKKASRACRA